MKQRYSVSERLTWLFVLYALRTYLVAVSMRDSKVKHVCATFGVKDVAHSMGVSRSTARRVLQAAHDVGWGSWRIDYGNHREKLFVMDLNFRVLHIDDSVYHDLQRFVDIVYSRELEHHNICLRAMKRNDPMSDTWTRLERRADERLQALEWFARDYGIVISLPIDDLSLTYRDA